MRISLRPKCTCDTHENRKGKHYLYCDLQYTTIKNMSPKKKKRFFIFYPLKRV